MPPPGNGLDLDVEADEAKLAELALPDTVPVPKPPKRAKRRRQQFIMVPWAWHERLAQAHSTASYTVALHLLHLNWKSGGQPVLLSNAALAGLGVERRAKWRAIRELEEIGLIRVETRPRKSPAITVLFAD